MQVVRFGVAWRLVWNVEKPQAQQGIPKWQ